MAEGVNPDLKAVHSQLVAMVAELEAAIGQAKTSAQVNAILDEIIEVNARVTVAGRQLFTRQTEEISEAASHVAKAVDETKEAIRRLEGITELIQTVTKFLGLVDKVIATAKLVT